MEVEVDEDGQIVAVVSVLDAVEFMSDRVGYPNALRAITALIEEICIEAGERGRKCPDAIKLDFSKLSTFRWV